MGLFDTTTSGLSRRERELRREISHLREKLADVSQSVADMGRGVYVDAASEAEHAFKDLRKRVRKAAPYLRRKEREIESLAREHPFTVVALASGIGLLAAALIVWNMERRR